jgi:hypothetical protein
MSEEVTVSYLLAGLLYILEVEDSNLDPPHLIVSVAFFSVYRNMSGLYCKIKQYHFFSVSLPLIIHRTSYHSMLCNLGS